MLGCKRVRDIQQMALGEWAQQRFRPNPPGASPGCQPLKQLTEEDVRRIVREEIANAMSSGVKS